MADVFEQQMLDAPVPLSDERDSRQALSDDLGMQTKLDDKIKAALLALYGDGFPLATGNDKPEEWAAWASNLWDRHRQGTTSRIHLTERNRLFRRGIQWVSSVAGTGWREPPKSKDSARVVFNMVAPALDQRAQIISEQRPGFKTRPATQDPDDIKKAEAKQKALEYQWDQQDMAEIVKEATYWSGTDGACFLELYWDPEAGPWHEAYGVDEQTGEQVPMGPDGAAAQEPHKFPLGEVKTMVRKLEQVRVSSNATATQAPWYWIVRDTIGHAEAIRKYGLQVAETTLVNVGPDGESSTTYGPFSKQGYVLPDEKELLKEQDTVTRYAVYCKSSEYLPKGLTLIVVGDEVVFQGPLLTGSIPLVRWTDGSTDPAFYPSPIMDGWLDAQQRINAVLSKWVENIRLNAGPKLLAKRQSLVGETLLGGSTTVIEAKGIGSLNDIIKPLDGFSLAADVKEFLMFEIKNFENLSGWNDVSRGQFSTEQSGRAILAIREQLERIFSPPVNAAAKSMTEWAKITCGFMHWGYDVPRTIGVVGRGRPDLVQALSGDDMDGTTDVWIDPETLMPLPRSLRLTLLDDLFQKGLLDPREYRRRLPFAYVGEMEFPDEVHFARARRAVEAMKQGINLPVLPQDDAQVHMDVLTREVILQDDLPMQLRFMAYERWSQYAMMAQQQMMQATMGMGGPTSPPPGQKPGGSLLSPTTQPFTGTNPGIKAGTLGGDSDERRNARMFDRQQSAQGAP